MSHPKYWWAEIILVFAILTAVGAILLPRLYGHDWSGSLLFYVAFPFQMFASLFSFSFLFLIRRYTKRLLVAVPAVLILSLLASFAMFVCGQIRMGSYLGP